MNAIKLTPDEQDVLLALQFADDNNERLLLSDFQTAENDSALPGLIKAGLIDCCPAESDYGLTLKGKEVVTSEWISPVDPEDLSVTVNLSKTF